jgi:hypothetical protein
MHQVHHVEEVFVQMLPLKTIARLSQSMLQNGIACEGAEQAENVELLPSIFKISHLG